MTYTKYQETITEIISKWGFDGIVFDISRPNKQKYWIDIYAIELPERNKETLIKKIPKKIISNYTKYGYEFIYCANANSPKQCYINLLKKVRIIDIKIKYLKMSDINGDYQNE